MTDNHFDKLAKAPKFARPPRPEEFANPVAGYGAVVHRTAARRGARAGRCNLRRSCRRNSGSG